MQPEQPGHLILPRSRAVLIPVPHALDQCKRRPAPGLGPILEELLELNRLLHPAWHPRRPEPSRLATLPQSLHRMQLHLRIEHSDEPVKLPLVEGPDELSNWINHVRAATQAPSSSMTLLELLP